MARSFWGRLEAQKHPAQQPLNRKKPTPYEERMAKRAARTARVLAELDKGTADDALRHANELLDGARRR